MADAHSLSFLLEHSPAIGKVTVTLLESGCPLAAPVPPLAGRLQFSITERLVRVAFVGQDHATGAPALALALAVPVDATSATLADASSEHATVITLRALVAAASVVSPEIERALDKVALLSATVRPAQLARVLCRGCGADLVDVAAAPTSVGRMPSEHWAELLDHWTCHGTPSVLARALARGPIEPRADVALDAPNFVFLHAANIATGALCPPTSWGSVRCASCDRTVGTAAGEACVQLLKCALVPADAPPPRERTVAALAAAAMAPRGAFSLATLERHCGSALFAASQAHGSFRFAVWDERDLADAGADGELHSDGGADLGADMPASTDALAGAGVGAATLGSSTRALPALMIWLLGTGSSVQLDVMAAHLAPAGDLARVSSLWALVPMPVVRVLYVETRVNAELAAATWDEWTGHHEIEELRLPDSDRGLRELVRWLEATNAMHAPSMRTHRGLRCAFLPFSSGNDD